jgi:hypothetical protein
MRPAAVPLLVFALLAAPVRGAEPGPGPVVQRFALVAGASNGGPGRAALRYATTDAREVARVLGQLGGVDGGDLVLLEDPDAGDLKKAIAKLGRRVADARSKGRRPELFVYYSGHSDEDGLLLDESRLSYPQLREALDDVPAEVRIAILDSCASGAFTRSKGGQARPAFEIDAANRVRGHAFLTSSAADEASQESDRLRASFFTHALLTGLRGAADSSGDGVVTLQEAYQFAFRETLARTEATKSGPQHATYDIALVGSGDVVMTDLRRAGAMLVLPEPLSGKVFVRDDQGHLVAELLKVPGARLDLAVEPGIYKVRVAREGRLQEASVTLIPGQRTPLPEGKLETVALETTLARGPAPDGDGPNVPMALPQPTPGAPTGRNVIVLSLGGAYLPGDRGTVAGSEIRAPDGTTIMLEMGYQRWLTDRFALEVGFLARGLEGSEKNEAGGANPVSTSSGSILSGVTLGAKYAYPIWPRRGLFLGVTGAAGAYAGINSSTTMEGDTVVNDSGTIQWVPGARLRLSLDYFVTRRFLLGVGVGYSQIGRFQKFVGARRDYSGPEAVLTFGFGWGR